MSENDVNDVNCGSDCGSCGGGDNVNDSGGSGGGDSPCCDSGNSHKQADLKMLVFVLVLILAGAVAANSLFNKDKGAGACGPGGCPSSSRQVDGCSSTDLADTLSGVCPVSGKSDASDDASITQCPAAGSDDVGRVFEGGEAASPCCPGSVATEEKEN